MNITADLISSIGYHLDTPSTIDDGSLIVVRFENDHMGLIFFDDSNHVDRGGFSLGAFVYTPTDRTWLINDALTRHGLTPGIDEFKSSSRMSRNPRQAALRNDLKGIMCRFASLAIVVAGNPADLAVESLLLLRKMIQHPDLAAREHEVYFDGGLLQTTKLRSAFEVRTAELERCALRIEQDSKLIVGIQLADLAAHTCAVMLLEELGIVKKTVKAGEFSGYDPDLDIEIGFELWAGIRSNFLSAPPPDIEDWQPGEIQPTADVRPYGLHVSQNVNEHVRQAAGNRFSTMYLGCIH